MRLKENSQVRKTPLVRGCVCRGVFLAFCYWLVLANALLTNYFSTFYQHTIIWFDYHFYSKWIFEPFIFNLIFNISGEGSTPNFFNCYIKISFHDFFSWLIFLHYCPLDPLSELKKTIYLKEYLIMFRVLSWNKSDPTGK